MKRSVQLLLIIAIIAIAIFVYTQIPVNGSEKPASNPPRSPIGEGGNYTLVINENITALRERNMNISFNVDSNSGVSAITLTGFSNLTPASLYLIGGSHYFDIIELANEKNAYTSDTTYSDPPYVTIPGGVWYLDINNVTSDGQIHVIVAYKA